MKHLSPKQRMRLIRTANKRKKRKRKSYYYSLNRKRHSADDNILMPIIFDIENQRHRSKVLKAIKEMHDKYKQNRKRVTLDFSNTRQMIAGGTLLFYAELRNLVNISHEAMYINCIKPKNNKASQVLKQIGLYRILRVRNNVTPIDDDVVCWKVTHGIKAEGDKFDKVVDSVETKFNSDHDKESLYIAFSESLTNTMNHAYSDKSLLSNREVAISKETWWMFSQIRKNKLTVVFCDLGAGIPGTLPKLKSFWGKIVSRNNHGKIIKEAIDISRTRTEEENRGKGLRQIVDKVTSVPDGQVMIMSNHGVYRRTFTGIVHASHEPESIHGTLISWIVPISSSEEEKCQPEKSLM